MPTIVNPFENETMQAPTRSTSATLGLPIVRTADLTPYTPKTQISVAAEYRTNPLSLIPGGHLVTLVRPNGFELHYDNIHYVSAYLTAIVNRVSMGNRNFPDRVRSMHATYPIVKVDGRVLFDLTEIRNTSLNHYIHLLR